MNFGIQRQVYKGTVLSVDFVRNVETRSLLGIDLNHSGDTRYFNLAGAQAAIANTIAACGASSLAGALAAGGCLPLEPTNLGAQMSDFATPGRPLRTSLASAALPSPVSLAPVAALPLVAHFPDSTREPPT